MNAKLNVSFREEFYCFVFWVATLLLQSSIDQISAYPGGREGSTGDGLLAVRAIAKLPMNFRKILLMFERFDEIPKLTSPR